MAEGKADPVLFQRTDDGGVVLDFSDSWYSEYRGDLDEFFEVQSHFTENREAGYTQRGKKGYTDRMRLDPDELNLFLARAKAKGLPISLKEASPEYTFNPIQEHIDISGAAKKGSDLSENAGKALAVGAGGLAAFDVATNPNTQAAIGRTIDKGAQAAAKSSTVGNVVKTLAGLASKRI
jgi:hypothetical protein